MHIKTFKAAYPAVYRHIQHRINYWDREQVFQAVNQVSLEHAQKPVRGTDDVHDTLRSLEMKLREK